MKTLLIDNYDSFTYNIYQLVAEVNKVRPIVIKNDEMIFEKIDFRSIDNVIISPGPGHPGRESDFGVCGRVILESRIPVLGVCLGHQGIASVYGGGVVKAPKAMHGRMSSIYHTGMDLFENIANPYNAVRYHSLIVDPNLPDCLVPTAWTIDGLIMGLRHKIRPLFGIQFHPESICTQHGYTLFDNFRKITLKHRSCEVALVKA